MADKKYTRDFSKNIGDGQTIKAETADCSALAGTPQIYLSVCPHPPPSACGYPSSHYRITDTRKKYLLSCSFPWYLY